MSYKHCGLHDCDATNGCVQCSATASVLECACGALLPSRARLRAVLDGALEHLNLAKLSDAVHGAPLSDQVTGQRWAMLAHALLRASSMLDRCERCLDAELERAAASIAERLTDGR